jgi:hypothetical protein
VMPSSSGPVSLCADPAPVSLHTTVTAVVTIERAVRGSLRMSLGSASGVKLRSTGSSVNTQPSARRGPSCVA